MQSKTKLLATPLATAVGAALALGGFADAADARPAKRGIVRPARVAPPAAGVQRPAGEVYLSIGRSQLITMPAPIADIFIANDGVADVKIQSPTQIYLFARGEGETSFYATNASGRVVYSANVRVSANLNSLEQVLRTTMPESSISVIYAGQSAILTGVAASPEDAAQAEQIARGMLNPGVNVTDPAAMLKMPVLNRLRLATPLQVNLQVRIAEVSRNIIKDFGSSLRTVDRTSGFKFGITQGRDGVTITGPGTGTINPIQGTQTTVGFLSKLFGVDVGAALDIGETQGLVSTLAQPNLTALSGQSANFLAGGEIPIPVLTPDGNGRYFTAITYKPYGISLSFTPTVLADGRISLKVKPEVSDIDNASAVTIDGSTIPGLSTRRVETSVELGSGQSFVLGGLLRTNAGSSITKTPGVGDVPILGALFRSNNFRRNETELVIVVTPYLVKPVSAGKIVLPTDGYQAPTDAGRILMNDLYKGQSGAKRPQPTMAPPQTVVQPGPGADAAPVHEDPVPASKPGAIAPGFGG